MGHGCSRRGSLRAEREAVLALAQVGGPIQAPSWPGGAPSSRGQGVGWGDKWLWPWAWGQAKDGCCGLAGEGQC